MHITNDIYGAMQIQKLKYRQRNEGMIMFDNVTILTESRPPIRTRIRNFIHSIKR